jgi:hypothetical protein
MKRTVRYLGITLLFALGLGAPRARAQQPVAAEPQAPGREVQTPAELVPALPVPRLVKFAGTMKDEQGKSRTSVVGVTFAIYKEQEGGAALWLETQNVELDEQGRYTVLLGSTKREGLSLELFATGEPRWLGVQVNLPKEVEQPRVLLVSVPYALKAADAETLGGKPLSSFVLASPATGSGGGVGTVLASTGAIGAATIGGGGTQNFVAKFDATGANVVNSTIFDNGTNVGIGTSSPARTLHVKSSAPTIRLEDTNLPNSFWELQQSAFVNDTFGFLRYENGAAVQDKSFVVSSAGNLGIGTGTPQRKLHIRSSAPVIRLEDTNLPNSFWELQQSAFVQDTFGFLRYENGAAVQNKSFVMSSAGNFGIGIGTPTQKLEVAGNVKISGGGNSLEFRDGSVMSSATMGVGGGTITGVTAGTGLSGGGTAGSVALSNTGVLSFNGRSGLVSPSTSDYSFPQISGTVSKVQLPMVTAYADQDNGFSAAQTFNKSITGTSASFSGSGSTAVVFGRNTTPTNFTAGVQGFSDSIDGMGVQGQALASSGSTFGVQGTAMSPSGIGVSGLSPSIGVKGEGSGTAGTGILALSLAGSGSTTGLRALVQSPLGTAGIFDATDLGLGAGKVLLGRKCGIGIPCVNVLQIDGSGNVAATSFTGNGAGLTNVNPAAGSSSYIQNGTTSQAAANFNISGNGSIGGNLALPNTNMAGSAGLVTLGGTPFLHNFGSNNTFVGASAGNVSLGGANNTAVGASALNASTTGLNNSAFGFQALLSDTTGSGNAAFGFTALTANTTACCNSAFGSGALQLNTGGSNSAFGSQALQSNTTGGSNDAFGGAALFQNTTGGSNAAFGDSALAFNTTGSNNAAFGRDALIHNTTGGSNAAFGVTALLNLTSGGSNIAIGQNAGSNLTAAESNDIYIGNTGVAGESNTIRIGSNQTATFMAGISGATSASGVAVLVNTSGQLGTTTSSRRFKEEIADLGGESDLLMKLRPVAFYYKPELDETHTRQYGLVAEEVAQVAPQLVVFDKDGAPQTVRYHFVNAMLLNEVQKQRQLVKEQSRTIVQQESKIQDLEARLARLEAAIAGR